MVGENYSDRGGTSLTVLLVILHEGFDPYTLDADLALIRVYEDIVSKYVYLIWFFILILTPQSIRKLEDFFGHISKTLSAGEIKKLWLILQSKDFDIPN